ncbi:hypothetical protein ACFX58_12870 [Sphingomonas sp. NCPPB 2930]
MGPMRTGFSTGSTFSLHAPIEGAGPAASNASSAAMRAGGGISQEFGRRRRDCENIDSTENETFVNVIGLLSRAIRLEQSPALDAWRSRAYKLQDQLVEALAGGVKENALHEFRQRENSLRYELQIHERLFSDTGPAYIDFDSFEYPVVHPAGPERHMRP